MSAFDPLLQEVLQHSSGPPGGTVDGWKETQTERCRELLERLDCPHRLLPAINVVGTNGKGSVSWKLAAALEASGRRVGLFTSPHLRRSHERIRVNREPVPYDRLMPLWERVKAASPAPLPSFSYWTALAWLAFQEARCDIVILEAGVGGRLDPTRFCQPILSVLTSVGLDHCDLLGDTLDTIGREKVGIARAGVPFVLGVDAALPGVLQEAARLGAPVVPLKGAFANTELHNTALARLALQHLPQPLGIPVEELLAMATPPGRWQCLRTAPPLYADVAHNEHAFARLMERMGETAPVPWAVICAFPERKEWGRCVDHLLSGPTQVLLLPTLQKALFPLVDTRTLVEHCRGRVEVLEVDAIEEALQMASRMQLPTLICGSHMIVSEAMDALETMESQQTTTPST